MLAGVCVARVPRFCGNETATLPEEANHLAGMRTVPGLHFHRAMRCLIVDDDDSPRELMARMLGGAGHRVAAAQDMDGARAALLAGGIDVVLLDLELPGLRGAEAIAAVRKLSPSSRVLVVSGHDDPRRVLAAIDAGADGYLLKDELAEALGGALQAVRAGHAPLSPRVAALVLRRMRRQGSQDGAAAPAAVGRLNSPPKVV